MKDGACYPRRRVLWTALIGTGILARAAVAGAATPTGIAALDTEAVRVKSPLHIFYVAITRAGDRLVAVGEHGVVIYSDDNGASWTQAAVPVNVTLTCVAFATPMIGWIAGHFGVILQTTDGGKTWVEQLNGIQVNQLALTAAQAIQPGDTTSPAFALGMKRAAFFVTLGPDKPFLTMLVLDARNVMVFGAYRMVVVTSDGGKTWSDRSLEIYDRLSHDLYSVAKIGPDIYIAAETGVVFCSTDGGQTFPQVTMPGAGTLFGVLGTRDGTVIVFGVAGSCYRSADGGKSWTPVVLATQDDITAGHVLASGAVLLACGGGQIFISKDNGVSFSAVPGLPPLPVSDFAQGADGNLVFAGGGGIFKDALTVFE